ncbi:hypothetical protein IMSHALPRED_010768 [Imshaugia aleurites]|uniref:Uncharacterized protein n=1 Tax=Imshaugia aleurites TaxID=172621 RepID=A0A8H3IZZ4_9LECA|nr:hypothetical protein IMSHALPRED_010768 [Imshaugia aleurites]
MASFGCLVFLLWPSHDHYSNWPEIMYYLHPPAEWTAFRSTPRPSQKTDANGQPMVERFPAPGQPPRPLLDFQNNVYPSDQHQSAMSTSSAGSSNSGHTVRGNATQMKRALSEASNRIAPG